MKLLKPMIDAVEPWWSRTTCNKGAEAELISAHDADATAPTIAME